MPTRPDLSVELAGVRLESPLVAAAGTCGYVDELADVVDTSLFGAITTKSITRRERAGNRPWRLAEVHGGMLNAVGLANMGIERFMSEVGPAITPGPPVVIGSIAGESVADYVEVAARFESIDAMRLVELNVSCPNTDNGLQFGEDPASLAELLAAVRPELATTRLFVKLSPNVTDVVAMARAAIEGGADGLTLINTVGAMAIDVETRRPRLGHGSGGLSGPAVHPIAVRMVHEVYLGIARERGIPIIGLGGVMRWSDAAELILAGASAVGMGTALLVDPGLAARVRRGLERWVARQGCASIRDLAGACAP